MTELHHRGTQDILIALPDARYALHVGLTAEFSLDATSRATRVTSAANDRS
jgi:hypothetical protein